MPFMMLSHPRSGSSFVNSVLRAHPNVASIQEPFSQHLDLFRSGDFLYWSADEYQEHLLHPTIDPSGFMDSYLREFRQWLLASDGTVRGFKETTVFEKIPWMERFVGTMPTILLVRDPRAVVASVMRRDQGGEWWGFERQFERYLAAGGTFPQTEFSNKLSAMVATLWNARMASSLAHAHRRGWLVVRLEDLIQQPYVWLPRLMQFIGVGVHPDQEEFLRDSWKETRGHAYSLWRAKSDVLEFWRENLDHDDQQIIVSIARQTMDQLYYY